MSEPVLSIQGLRVDIETPRGILQAVRDISFDIMPAQTVCLVGESGCGKSMTALSVMGLAPPKAKVAARQIRFEGEDVGAGGVARLRRLRGDRMSMIFQEPMTALNPAYMIGNQLIEVHRRHKGSTHAEARDRAIYLLERVGIGSAADRLRQYPHQLSGGLRQRVMIAMALMCGPSLILADEPTTALDVTIQVQILRLLLDLQKEFGVALLLITHDMGVVARMARDVHVMYAGEIVESAPAEALFARPGHPYTQALLRCIPGSGSGQGRLATIPGTVPSLVGGIEGCAFRDRCEFAVPACAVDVPVRTAEFDHRYRCVREFA